MRESRVRFPAGPTLGVLKYLKRRCCLCFNICKWLDFCVFSDKDVRNRRPLETYLCLPLYLPRFMEAVWLSGQSWRFECRKTRVQIPDSDYWMNLSSVIPGANLPRFTCPSVDLVSKNLGDAYENFSNYWVQKAILCVQDFY